MGTMASQITSLTVVYSIVYSDADQRKHQGSASLTFVRGIHRRPVNSPHKWPVTRKMFPFDDVIMEITELNYSASFICNEPRSVMWLATRQKKCQYQFRIQKKWLSGFFLNKNTPFVRLLDQTTSNSAESYHLISQFHQCCDINGIGLFML